MGESDIEPEDWDIQEEEVEDESVELSNDERMALKELLKRREEDRKEMERLREEVKALKEKASGPRKTKLLGKSIPEAAQSLMEILDKGVSHEPVRVFLVREGDVAQDELIEWLSIGECQNWKKPEPEQDFKKMSKRFKHIQQKWMKRVEKIGVDWCEEDLPTGITGSKGEQALVLQGAKPVWKPIRVQLDILMLGAQDSGAVSLKEVLDGFYITACEGYRAWYELTLQAQFQQIANGSLSRQFVQDLAKSSQPVEAKKKEVREEVSRHIAKMQVDTWKLALNNVNNQGSRGRGRNSEDWVRERGRSLGRGRGARGRSSHTNYNITNPQQQQANGGEEQ
jgi:hypothetical protein